VLWSGFGIAARELTEDLDRLHEGESQCLRG
jgi:hypothetical protein